MVCELNAHYGQSFLSGIFVVQVLLFTVIDMIEKIQFPKHITRFLVSKRLSLSTNQFPKYITFKNKMNILPLECLLDFPLIKVQCIMVIHVSQLNRILVKTKLVYMSPQLHNINNMLAIRFFLNAAVLVK